jgi:nucleotide-binding universal stress UspA family protein
VKNDFHFESNGLLFCQIIASLSVKLEGIVETKRHVSCGTNQKAEERNMFQLFERILCPVDFSVYSDLAMKYATALARECDASLVVYHSVPDLDQVSNYVEGNFIQTVTETLLASGKDKLQEYTSRLIPKDVAFKQIVGTGSAAERILQISSKEGVDLIVMGTHGYSGFDQYLIGSVTNRVLHKCTVPLLAVCKPRHHFIQEGAEHPVSIQRILCALDQEPNCRRIAQMGTALAGAYQSEIQFLRVLRKDSTDCEQEQIQLMREIAEMEGRETKAIFTVKYGEPAQEILQTVNRNHVDLVIMGHHTRKAFEEYVLGSITKRVIPDCACPVLIVRSAADLIPASILETESEVLKYGEVC